MVLDDFLKGISTKAGVYQFYVYPLGKYYIGESVNIRRRVKEHLTKGGNIDIACMIEMYGLDCIGFQILKFEDDRQKRLELENYYKNLYGRSKTLNKVEGVESLPPDQSKSVVIYKTDGVYVGKYKNSLEAAERLKLNANVLRQVATGDKKTHRGYFCFYESEDQNLEEIIKLKVENLKETKKRQRCQLDKIREDAIDCLRISVYGKHRNTGEEFIFNSATHAAKELNLNRSKISACCRGEQKTSGKIYWSYINE